MFNHSGDKTEVLKHLRGDASPKARCISYMWWPNHCTAAILSKPWSLSSLAVPGECLGKREHVIHKCQVGVQV
jgi:hypothetical protein